MQATLDGRAIAASDAIVECHGCQYFPRAAVRIDWLRKAPETESDLECQHGVQFGDVAIDGARRERPAGPSEAPRAAMRQVAGRVGLWKDVGVG
jgi:uncharacterized protein (DUF427 family)